MADGKIKKIKMGARQLLNPKPVVLVGTVLDNKPNFITVSWTGLTSDDPPTMSVAIRKIRYSLKGMDNNKTFSVNIPSVDMVKETDYCGNYSGLDHDKVKECGFNIFYGTLSNAPLIEECPVNIECKVIRQIDINDHILFIGEIVETYISENCITKNIPNVKKINPLCFCTFTTEAMGYYEIGKFVTNTGTAKNKLEVLE
jgi:flavin reductase (DIM6/NTAB) family NADH-FMN oxidoreductase RutF